MSYPTNARSFARPLGRTQALAIVAGLASMPIAAVAQPTITNLGSLMGTSNAAAVNSDGTVVVGTSDYVPFPGGTRPFRWTSPGGMSNLGTLGGIYGSANGVSADGLIVVGSSETAFRWSAGLGLVSLGALSGGIGSWASGVSADGSIIVGGSSSSLGGRAFRWTGALVGMESLGTLPGGSDSAARGVSGDGSVIVGESSGSGGTYFGFRWTPATGMVSLGTLPGAPLAYGSSAYGVSSDGSVIVGKGGTPFGTRAFRWTSAGGMANLGPFPGGTTTEARGVSGDGSKVVGWGMTSLGSRAFLWTSALGLVDLNTYLPTLGTDLTDWTLDQATAISADGTTIVGWGTILGEMRAWRISGLGTPCYANCDASTTAPCLNVLDFACYLNRFATGDTAANCDGSTTAPVLNVLDFSCFINRFAAGCSSC